MLFKPACWKAFNSHNSWLAYWQYFLRLKACKKNHLAKHPSSACFPSSGLPGEQPGQTKLLTQFEGLENDHVSHWDNRAKYQAPEKLQPQVSSITGVPTGWAEEIRGNLPFSHLAVSPCGFQAPWHCDWCHRGPFLFSFPAGSANSNSESDSSVIGNQNKPGNLEEEL